MRVAARSRVTRRGHAQMRSGTVRCRDPVPCQCAVSARTAVQRTSPGGKRDRVRSVSLGTGVSDGLPLCGGTVASLVRKRD
jgi:hypothetical protein